MELTYCGSSGGTGGKEFCDDIHKQDCQVMEVHIYSQQRVNAIQIIHETCNGERHSFPLHGSAFGDHYVLKLDGDEFITSINGQYNMQIDSIRIQTNKKTSPLLGEGSDTGEYRYEVPPGSEIVGFFGRDSDMLHAIGVIMRRRGL